MNFKIQQCSAKAAEKIESSNDVFGVSINTHHLTKYPFDQMHIGQSFAVPMDLNTESTVRISASAKNKKTGKKFVVIKHAELDVLEVARVG